MSKREKRDGWIKVEDLLEQAKSNPEWVRRNEEHERRQREFTERFRREEEILVKELQKAGCHVSSIGDLVTRREPYPEAIPILLRHLSNTSYQPAIREAIARALTVKDPQVKAAVPELIEAFKRDPDDRTNGPKWCIANALEVLYEEKKHLHAIIDLALDPSHGPARDVLVLALARSKSDLAGEALRKLVADPYEDVAIVARDRLARWERRRARRLQKERPRA